MLIFLYGDDSYRLNQAREEILTKYRTKHGSGFNLFFIDGSERGSASNVSNALKTSSLFDESKLVVVRNIFNQSDDATQILELLEKFKIVTDPKIVVLATHVGTTASAKPKELFTILSDKKNLVREFKSLEGVQLQAWIKKEAFLRDVSFDSPKSLARFISVGGSDSWSRINNLEKLANYCKGTISQDAVDLLIKTETEPNVFEFIDAIGSGRRAQAFSLLCGELAFGREPYYLLTMVMYQVRNMLIVKDLADRNMAPAQIAQKAGIHPFVVKKMLSATARMPLADIKRLYQEVMDLEQGTKQGRRDLEDGLFSLALS